MSLELEIRTILGANGEMVVDLAVHGKDEFAVVADQRLSSRV